MNTEDVIYVAALILSIAVGYVFQNIADTCRKKWFSTITGISIIFLVCGFHTLHALLLTLIIGSVIQSRRRNCHLISFLLGFGYLVFFRTTMYFGIPTPSGHANMIQMILTLKLVGLAFEVRDNYSIKRKLEKEENDITYQERYKSFPDPWLIDVFHYSFCYAGVLTGPYYTYRSYCDVFQYPRQELNFCFKAALKTCAYIPFFSALYLLTSWAFPLQVLYSNSFYENTSLLYRLWYMYPTFFIFRTRLYIAFKLSEAVCMMAAIGLYPSITKPKLGSGPSANFEELEKASSQCVDLSFETINSINVYQAEFSYTVREATRHWNRSVQYWLAAYVYKRFSYKPLRTLATFFVSSFWHGIHGGYYFSLFSVPLYLFVEDTLLKRVIKSDRSTIKNLVLYNAKMFQFSYWGLAFQVKNYSDVWRFGQSIYFMPYMVAAIMYLYATYHNGK